MRVSGLSVRAVSVNLVMLGPKQVTFWKTNYHV